jgi:hypothetical protein
MTACNHQWGIYIPPSVYKCVACGQVRLQFERKKP